jgi:hypothetical protein
VFALITAHPATVVPLITWRTPHLHHAGYAAEVLLDPGLQHRGLDGSSA